MFGLINTLFHLTSKPCVYSLSYLSHNKISILKPGVFRDLHKLEWLYVVFTQCLKQNLYKLICEGKKVLKVHIDFPTNRCWHQFALFSSINT